LKSYGSFDQRYQGRVLPFAIMVVTRDHGHFLCGELFSNKSRAITGIL
jgi:hypothetical protein